MVLYDGSASLYVDHSSMGDEVYLLDQITPIDVIRYLYSR